MKKKLIIALAIVAIISTVVYFKFRSKPEINALPEVWVKALQVKASTLPITVKAIGTLVARSVEITPEMPGHVREIFFTDGHVVKKDEPLIQLDDALYKAKFASSAAQLSYSKNDYKRKDLLAKQGVITQQAIDQAFADLKEKKANRDENAVMVSKMQLLAPFSGMVGKSKINLGDYVTTGQSMVTLTDTKHLRIEYNVPEKFLPFLKLGQKVSVTTATFPDKKFIGTVSFISPTISIENRSVSLYAEMVNEKNELTAGMFVTVKQSLGKEEKTIIIPSRSLVPILDGEQVYKIVDGKAYGVNVMVGKRKNDNIQILQGLKLGDEIITDGQMKVKNGMPVRVRG